MQNAKKIFLLICLGLGLFLQAQELPPVQNYGPSDYQAENQNWGISQSKEKIIYVANSKGLLEFNGARWNLFPAPEETAMRSVKVVGDKIYTGSYMEFGYWQKNNPGRLQYTSLSKKLRHKLLSDEEFWNILNLDRWVVFQSLNRIYIYDTTDDTASVINSEAVIHKTFKIDESVYFQRLEKGLFKIENGKDVLVSAEMVFREDEIVNIFQEDGALLILSGHNGFYRLTDGSVKKWAIDANPQLNRTSIYSGLQLKNGGFALGTISHGIILLDNNGNQIFQIDQINGLRNNTVLSLFEDADRNIWAGLDNGLSYINLTSPFRVFHNNKGALGSVYASAVKDDILYLGTNQGLFYKKLGGALGFQLVPSTQGQVWALNLLDDTLFCGHHSGTFVINRSTAKKISTIPGAWKIGNLSTSKKLLLQGNYDGLYVLEKKDNNWHLRNKISGFDHSSRYFEVFDRAIFVNHEYNGVFKIETDSAFTKATKVRVDTTIRGHNSGIAKFKNNLLYAYKKGILKYNLKNKRFEKDSLLSAAYTEDEYVSGKMITDSINKRLWVFSKPGICFITEGKLASKPIIKSVPLSENARSGIVGYENLTWLEQEDKYLFGTSLGYISIKPQDTFESEPKVNLSSIKHGNKNASEKNHRLLNKNLKGNFKSDENNIKIGFYTPYYHRFLKPKYQYQLKGMYNNWSHWSANATASFENLPSGDYTFNVRAKAGNRLSENTASYTFQIKRPWYFSNLALGFYFLVLVAASILIHQTYKRVYRKRQKKLIEQNKHELQLAAAQNEKKLIKIKNQQLKQDFRNKSNELAASTLSIIKKNELLSKIKEDLAEKLKDNESVKPILNIIDQNLKQNDDWELFKEAFNNADRKFLKKLKKAHPNLTPNDIRLCAYLRLNLSSKEIAPLLSISARSVEIKRYRLRKKMGLSTTDNLVNYILKL